MEQKEHVLNIPVVWRGEKFLVEINSGSSLRELGDELQRMANVKADTVRLIVSQASSKGTRLYSPFSEGHSRLSLHEAHIIEGKLIRMMGVSEEEVDEVLQIAKTDLRIIGFEEEEQRQKQRISGKPAGSLKPPQGTYIFCDFKTLEIPGFQLNPPASEALRLLHKLASDPGIVAIMNKHYWRVGMLTEMAPVGYVGISPKCLLGLNKNFGEEISLRIRTDDFKGFRKYDTVKKTLLHELAHMVYSEHDANFYALDRQLNHEAATLDWTKSKSYSLNGKKQVEYYGEESYVEERKEIPHRLGGEDSVFTPSAREASISAAYRRFSVSSTQMASEASNQPIADCHGSCMMDGINLPSSREKLDEPDPDDCISRRNSLIEPDPDDSVRSADEPDPDNCMRLDELHSGVRDSGGLGFETHNSFLSEELRRVEDPAADMHTRLQKAVQMCCEIESIHSSAVLETLFKIVRNLIEHPNELKFKRLRLANPIFQRTVASHKAAMELLSLVGFVEDTVVDALGKMENYLVMTRNDPGLLWLAKSSLEGCVPS